MGGGGVRGVGLGGGGQVGCERRIEVFVKVQKKKLGGGGSDWGGGGAVDVIEELKFLGKFTHKIRVERGGGGQGGCE